jgi:class 3 adenylate cyclase/S1-C subfamily serine protease
MSEERRVVTTLFCDLVGFTALSERHDAEVVHIFLRRYYATVRRVVESYGGTVEKFIGDAVVAVFGVPAVHEDDPERAVRAGLRIVDEVDALPGISGEAVEVRVGINTGEALVRLDVELASGEGTLTGDAVNVAARLQSVAPPMAVAVGEATYAATRKVFSFDVCHPVTLKGKSKPISAWLATAPLARTGSELRSFTTSFVGREEELAVLHGLLDTVAETGEPRCVLVSGEPGIGKSRLLAEFARRLDDEPDTVIWRQGRCLPFGSGVTFWALSELVKAQAGVLESDGVARTEARLEAVLPEGEARDRQRARLRPLLGLEAEEATREENFAAWREFLEGFAAEHPVVVAVEDLHWADDAMLGFMDYLAETLKGVPTLVIATARPELLERTGPGAPFVEAAVRVTVEPLSGEETAELARTRLGAQSLPTDLQALILERSGGNPLFAEELVRLLEDRDLLDSRSGRVSLKPGAEVPMPDSIGALIAARLDLLSADRKALLSDAAVIGRTFWAGAVAAVGPHDAGEVFEGLHELVAKELVRPERGTTIEGETEFVFVHALVRDVAYDQLTRADRAAKHAALARWLEGRTAGRTEDLAEVLAFHYGTALDMATSCGLEDLEDELADPTTRYLELAGGRAAPLDAAAAAAHYARAERVADEAAKPKRRWLLSRRTRRTLKRRAPMLVAAAAIAAIALAALAAFAIYEFRPLGSGTAQAAPQALTPAQMTSAYGPSVVDVTVRVPGKSSPVNQSGVIVSKDGLVYTSGAELTGADTAMIGLYGGTWGYRRVRAHRVDTRADRSCAVFKIDHAIDGLTPVPLGDASTLSSNDTVRILGRAERQLWPAGASVMDVVRVRGRGGVDRCAALDLFYNKGDHVVGEPVFDTKARLVAVMGNYYPPDAEPMVGFDVAVAVSTFAEAQRYTPTQIAEKYGDAVVDISGEVRKVVDSRVVSGRFHQVGVVVSRSGVIYTSGAALDRWPVINEPVVVTVGVHEPGGRYVTVRGQVISAGMSGDVGLIKVDPSKVRLTWVPVGDSEGVKAGEQVLVGSRDDGGLSTVTTTIDKTVRGEVTANGWDGAADRFKVLAMETGAHPAGPVGGGVIDLTGHLIGIMTNSYRSYRPARGDLLGPNVAVSSASFQRRFVALRGVQYNDLEISLGIYLTDRIKAANAAVGYAAASGVVVGAVIPGSPAAEAGLRGATRVGTYSGGPITEPIDWNRIAFLDGDIIVAVDGLPVDAEEDVNRALAKARPGDLVTLSIIRGSKRLDLPVKAAPSWPYKARIW